MDCKILLYFSLKEEIYTDLAMAEMSDILEETGCLPPCHYMEYSLGLLPLHEEADFTFLEIVTAGSKVTVKKEILVYPFTSLVAEVGGALGLFLGFSFLMIWDIMEIVKSRFQR